MSFMQSKTCLNELEISEHGFGNFGTLWGFYVIGCQASLSADLQ